MAEYDIFDQATHTMTSNVAQLMKKAAQPLPMSFSDFIKVLTMQEEFLKSFFTVQCNAWAKLRAF